MCFLESCQWKCKRGEVSRLAVFCSLLVRLTLSGQGFEAWVPGGLFSAVSLPHRLTLPSFHPGPQTRLASVASSSERWCLPSANCKAPQLWSHWCEPMNNTCFFCRGGRQCQSWPQLYLSSVLQPSPTHTCVHPRPARCTSKRNMYFHASEKKKMLPKYNFPSTDVSTNVSYNIASLEKTLSAAMHPLIVLRDHCSLLRLWKNK